MNLEIFDAQYIADVSMKFAVVVGLGQQRIGKDGVFDKSALFVDG